MKETLVALNNGALMSDKEAIQIFKDADINGDNLLTEKEIVYQAVQQSTAKVDETAARVCPPKLPNNLRQTIESEAEFPSACRAELAACLADCECSYTLLGVSKTFEDECTARLSQPTPETSVPVIDA
eukprot:COSAG01_NODE_34002_length_555_cov_0.817982_1_plen_127_part_10